MTGIGIVDVSYSGLDLCASGKGAYRITARSRGNLNLGAAWIRPEYNYIPYLIIR
jgi:hypothetical protein